MQLEVILRLILIIYCVVSVFIIFYLFCNSNSETNVEKQLKLYRSEIERTEYELNLNNKKISDLDHKILKYKKRLSNIKK